MKEGGIGLGATYLGEGRCGFCVWAPLAQEVAVHLAAPAERLEPLDKDEWGYHRAILDGIEPGALYAYRLDGRTERPDPASRFQPQGVHQPSAVVDPAFPWEDQRWCGLPFADYILYELHVGAFTQEGTFDAVISHLDRLRDLGVTALELMPVAQFPGDRNWGYDGVYPFAAHNGYGGPDALKRLINACHGRGLAVVLDVVYNHLGPEGNYLGDFGPYFTDSYRTPWGAAVNFDGPHSDEVRRYFIENALHWLTEFHVDALRLDAVHAIRDFSARPFLEELNRITRRRAAQLNRRFYLIAESNLNDARLIRPRELGGCGLRAQWNDDFHHALHALLTGEDSGYYVDFRGVGTMARAFRECYVYTGQYSRYRRRRHGSSARLNRCDQFVVFAQNHDQVGNRMLGERLGALVDFERLKLASGLVLLSPFVPLLFMGEEYGETAPFQYFASHSDPALIEAVRQGRAEEFAAFRWQGVVPDPQDEQTFLRCKLCHALIDQPRHRQLHNFYRELISLRRELPALAHLCRDSLEAADDEEKKVLCVRRWHDSGEVFLLFNFSPMTVSVPALLSPGRWRKRIDSADRQWGGEGAATADWLDSAGEAEISLNRWAFCLFVRSEET